MPLIDSFTSPRGKALLGIIGGATVLTFGATYMEARAVRKKELEKREESQLEAHHRHISPERHWQFEPLVGSKPQDAVIVNHRPAVDAKMRGAQPSASKFV